MFEEKPRADGLRPSNGIQLLRTHNPLVAGSSPARPTKGLDSLQAAFCALRRARAIFLVTNCRSDSALGVRNALLHETALGRAGQFLFGGLCLAGRRRPGCLGIGIALLQETGL